MDQNNEQNYPWTREAPAEPVKKGGRFNAAFTQPLFLVICILLTITVVLSGLSAFVSQWLDMFIYTNAVNVAILFFSIGAWIIYGKAKKGISPLAGMKISSGAVMARLIIPIAFFGGVAVIYWIALINAIITGSPVMFLKFNVGSVHSIQTYFLAVFLGVIITAFCAGAIVIYAVIYRKVHKFTKSMCLVEDGKAENVECAKTARGWYKVVGILVAVTGGISCISSVGNFLSIKSDGILIVVGMFTGENLTDLSLYVNSFLFSLCGAIGQVTLAVAYLIISKWIRNNTEILK